MSSLLKWKLSSLKPLTQRIHQATRGQTGRRGQSKTRTQMWSSLSAWRASTKRRPCFCEELPERLYLQFTKYRCSSISHWCRHPTKRHFSRFSLYCCLWFPNLHGGDGGGTHTPKTFSSHIQSEFKILPVLPLLLLSRWGVCAQSYQNSRFYICKIQYTG